MSLPPSITYSGPASVKMFGAKGDGGSDDTAAIRRANTAVWQGGGGKLVYPPGEYILSDTIVTGVGVHHCGETLAQSRIKMVKDLDAFRTFEADKLLKTGVDSGSFDEDLIFECLTISMPQDGMNGAALVVKQPGEAHCIRNLHINYGGYGIRSLGVGAPGLRAEYCTISNSYKAGIYIQGWITDTLWLGYGGPCLFIGLSGDNRRLDDAHAALLEIDRCYGPVEVICSKAEGTFSKGVLRYKFGTREGFGNSLDQRASIAIRSCTGNLNSADYLVLDSDGGPLVPCAMIENTNPTGAINMIRNAFNGERVLSKGYLQGMRPIYYGDDQ